MKNTFGNALSVTLFGESHGEAIGATLDGLSPGITVDEEFIISRLSRRRAQGKTATARTEADVPHIVSGVFEGKTTGTPVTILISNENTKSKDYDATHALARPSHADYTAYKKYHGFEDYRGGGHFSGRITAALTAAGSIAEYALLQKGIRIGTHMARCAGLSDRPFENLSADIDYLSSLPSDVFPVLDEKSGKKMEEAILAAKEKLDSVGGVLETAVTGLPAGIGEPWFDSMESVLSHGLFSIPAVKGVEFGDGFSLADAFGSEVNDPFSSDGKNVYTLTNHNGGINGGISNGMPILFRTAFKPTPSIAREQDTVNLFTNEHEKLVIHGRHDPCVVRRAAPVVDAVCALCLYDLLAVRYGTDYFAPEAKGEKQ